MELEENLRDSNVGYNRNSQSQGYPGSTRGPSINNNQQNLTGGGRDNSKGQGSSQRTIPNEKLNSRPRGTDQNPGQRRSNTNQKFAGGFKQSSSKEFAGNNRGTSKIVYQGLIGVDRGQRSSQRECQNEDFNGRPIGTSLKPGQWTENK